MKSKSALGAQDESGDDFMRVNGLFLVVDHAGLDQLDEAIGEHLGVDAQVA